MKYTNIIDWPFKSYPDGMAIIEIDPSAAKKYKPDQEYYFIPNEEPYAKIIESYFGDVWQENDELSYTPKALFDTVREAENDLLKRVLEYDDFEDE